MKKFLSTALLLLYLAESSIAQEPIRNEEDLKELLERGGISTKTYESLSRLLEDKVDINGYDLRGLERIPGITFLDTAKILEYRQKEGFFKELQDLKRVPNISVEKYEKLKAFIRLSKVWSRTFKGRIKLKWEDTLEGEENYRFYQDIRSVYGKYIDGYISFKKDDDRNEVTYQYLKLMDIGWIRRFVVGNYKAIFGKNLVLSDEFTGALLEVKGERLVPTFIYSKTETEELIGTNIDVINIGGINIGGTWYKSSILPHIYGLHVNTKINNIEFSSEIAIEDGERAYILVGTFELDPFQLLNIYRDYSQNFNNPKSNGFGKNDRDEQGVYLELVYKPFNRLRIKANFDQWKGVSNLVTNNEKVLELHYELSKRSEVRVSRLWKDEDIEVQGGKSIKSRIELVIHPTPKIKTNLYYGYITIPGSGEMEEYLKGRLRYKLTDKLEVEYEGRFIDYDVSKQGDTTILHAGEIKITPYRYLELLFKYINTKYSDDYTPNPKHQVKIQSIFKW
ncbi:MAG: helix-hairpin-helix domain-containing protein [bacterium]|nr:helix-hairpin-helix domain-containing protein [bacterium]